ncbi:MAG: MBL fold metallo-hydrolase [Pseudomonadota bacterium]|uniref:MBL fold metallo-hydrolase n=1 Tax=Roseovarius TaxID=74030 RepID=UPI0022A8950E|nr:MBL fold metallo-hydrolase [Roseovarius sp. EGI FJ00037]MCZ0812700.1 MBL fold metallo-hydrolase [Roseovarius sp. EGI FJ00037]
MIRFVFALVFAQICLGAPALAQQDRRPSHCIAIAQTTPGIAYLHKASFRDPVPDHSVRLRYIAHASFLIQTEDGLSAVTDFTGFVGNVDFIPDVVTMNHAHSTHWTANPDPLIPNVLPGWGEFGEGVDHHVDLGSMLVRNVPTDIRSWDGTVETNGNSIFVFEAAGLCIAHLGHLHHEPSDEQYAALGRMDVVMAPVDGGLTLPLENMMNVLRRTKARIVIPMHWFADGSLGRFLSGMEDAFDIIDTGAHEITVSLRSLPARPTIMVLRPAYLREDE